MGMRKKVATKNKAKGLNKVADKLEAKKAEVEKKTAAKIAKTTATTTTLNAGEKAVVKGKVQAALAKQMALVKAGKAPKDVTDKAAAAKAAAKAGAKNVAVDKTKAAANANCTRGGEESP